MERFDTHLRDEVGKMPNYIVTKTQSSVGALGEVGPQPNALRCLQPHSRANSGSWHPWWACTPTTGLRFEACTTPVHQANLLKSPGSSTCKLRMDWKSRRSPWHSGGSTGTYLHTAPMPLVLWWASLKNHPNHGTWHGLWNLCGCKYIATFSHSVWPLPHSHNHCCSQPVAWLYKKRKPP